MTRSAIGLPVDGPWIHQGIRVTCERQPAAELMTQFWPLYEEAFAPLRTVAAARQVLTEEEFADEIADPRVWKYVAWDDQGEPIGLTTLTDDLSVVPWISPEYFAHHYPEAWERRAVYYLPFTLTKPSLRNAGLFFAMLRPIVLRVSARLGVCAYDVCGYNNETLNLARGIERLCHRLAQVDVSTVDVQTYYAIVTSGILND